MWTFFSSSLRMGAALKQSGVLREDLNFRGLLLSSHNHVFFFSRKYQLPIPREDQTFVAFDTLALTVLCLCFSNYGNYQLWQLPILHPPFFVSKNLHKTYISRLPWEIAAP